MKDSVCPRKRPDYPLKNSTLKRMFDLCAEETITGGQVEQILAPVRRMIREGKFDKPHRFLYPAQPLTLTASMAVLAIIETMAQKNTTDSARTDMPSNRVTLTVKGVTGMKLTLVNADSMEIYDPKVEEVDKTCSFEGVPDGTYWLILSQASDTANGKDAGTQTISDKRAEPVSGGAREKLWEGVDLQVCIAKRREYGLK